MSYNKIPPGLLLKYFNIDIGCFDRQRNKFADKRWSLGRYSSLAD
jgi:hypothetical protein